MTFLEARQNLARKLNIDYANIANNSLYTDADLIEWIQEGEKRAWDYKPWSFTLKTYKATSTSDGYYDYPTDFEDDSITQLSIAGNEYEEINWNDYQKWFNDNPTDTTRLWANHGRFYFANKNADTVGGEINITGKLRAPTLSQDTDNLLFSPDVDNQESSGNHGVVILAYAEALGSEKLKNPNQAVIEEKRAFAMLDHVWEPMGERKARAQSKERPFFTTRDYFPNPQRGSPRSTNIGNFP